MFPKYFVFGQSDSSLHGCVRCDAEDRCYLVAPTGKEIPIPNLGLIHWEKRVAAGRMSEATKGQVHQTVQEEIHGPQGRGWRIPRLMAFRRKHSSQ